jgi:hypothetical protein
MLDISQESVIRLVGAIRSECLVAKALKPKASIHAVSEGASAPSFIIYCVIRLVQVHFLHNFKEGICHEESTKSST